MMRLAAIAICLAAPAAAQTFQLPAGCEGFLTVQMASCSVSHHFTCTQDAAGEQRRADLDEDGLSYVGRTNDEAEWVESLHLRSAHSEQLGASVDPMSMSELIANGTDTWDFSTTSAEIGESRYKGMDRLTGESVVIDGVTLLGTENELTAFDAFGTRLWSSSGREFINPDWRMFLSGESSYVTSDDTFDSDDTPVEFIFPGEAGYLSVNPKYGCGAQMSMLVLE